MAVAFEVVAGGEDGAVSAIEDADGEGTASTGNRRLRKTCLQKLTSSVRMVSMLERAAFCFKLWQRAANLRRAGAKTSSGAN